MDVLSDSASPLYEKVKDFVLGNIGSGKWARNTRLPSENELVSALGVSRMTVHRALRELTSEGHLRRIQGVGTFVAPPKPQSTLIEISNIATEIRGRGLIWAIELDRAIAEEAVNLCMQEGLLANNVKPTAIRIIPPLTVSEAELDAAVDIIDRVLAQLA